jgi:cytoskeletal protein CcmA (bactofilin family)
MSTQEQRVTAAVITSDLKITGNVETINKLLIEGEVLGEVRGSAVVIDKLGRVTGGIVAEEVVVSGVVLGSIRGKRVFLQSSSRVEGDIFHESLLIEEGASFQGRLHRFTHWTREPAPFSQ